MKDFLKIVKFLESSGLLIKGVSETIQNEAKEQKGGFISMLLGTQKYIIFCNLEIQKYYENERKFNGFIQETIYLK